MEEVVTPLQWPEYAACGARTEGHEVRRRVQMATPIILHGLADELGDRAAEALGGAPKVLVDWLAYIDRDGPHTLIIMYPSSKAKWRHDSDYLPRRSSCGSSTTRSIVFGSACWYAVLSACRLFHPPAAATSTSGWCFRSVAHLRR